METVFDALKAMGKATSVELAARLDISREEVLNELWELKRNGVVDKTGHTWFLAGEGESRVPSLDNLRQASLLRTPTASVPHIPATHLEVTCGYYFDLFWYRNSGW